MNVQNRHVAGDRIPSRKAEPIAIIGMSCRFPNEADTLGKYWDLLVSGRTTVCELPSERWEGYRSNAPRIASALASATKVGSFLSDIRHFDADFFGISPREAECMDPQQRIVLELSWEALEHAGIRPSSLRGQDVGVYMAANSFDYGHRMIADLSDIRPWTVNGGMLFGIANRVSYALDFRGPSMTVDTACAGSLTVLHLACQGLWQGDISLAVVGGINIMSNPGMMIALDSSGATTPDGRSKAFDESADGYGRGEGAGLVVVKRLSDAKRDGDRVLALVVGGGVFQDGKTAGMMAPNAEAQENMLRKIYDRFDIDPLSVGYVEAHGTGTKAGDTAEVSALSAVFGREREANAPCLLGSVKPNIGHLEAGAGMAGLIKTVLAMQNGVLPPSVYDRLNRQITWEENGLKVVTGPVAWPDSDQPRRAGVSCFGVGGTIAHAILEEPIQVPAGDETTRPEPALRLFPLSARSGEAVRRYAERLATWLKANPEADLADVGKTLAHHRDHLSRRGALVANSRASLIEGLCAFASAEASSADGTLGSENGVVFVFSGHGAQWPGMARQMMADSKVFSAAIAGLDDIFKEELGYTATTAIAQSDWSTIERVQALTFAIQVALTEVWRSLGLAPRAIIGHSVGEVAAAVAAGAIETRSAARFACRRASLYQCLAGRGAMSMARLSFAQASLRLGTHGDVVAAIDASPFSTVISGTPEAVSKIEKAWKRDGIAVRRIASDAAFHSPQIDALLPEIRAAAADLALRTPHTTLYTTTLPDPRAEAPRDAEFWAVNSRQQVRLTGAVEAALSDGFRAFLEVSSAPIVSPSVRDIADAFGNEAVVVCGTLRPKKDEIGSMGATLAELYSSGIDLDWSRMFAEGRLLDLPTMAWQRRPFWRDATDTPLEALSGHAPDTHSLLGWAQSVSSDASLTVWNTQLDLETRPYPGRHPLFGVEIVPAAALLYSLMRTDGEDVTAVALDKVRLLTPVPVERHTDLQIVRHRNALRIATKPAASSSGAMSAVSWTTHTMATLAPAAVPEPESAPPDWGEGCGERWSWEEVEALYRKRGIGGYGFPWRLTDLRRGEAGIVARFASDPTERVSGAYTWAELLDAALTICPLLLPDDEILRMPSQIERVALYREPPRHYTIFACRTLAAADDEPDACRLDVKIFCDDTLCAEIDGVLFSVLDGQTVFQTLQKDFAFVPTWQPALLRSPAEASARRIALVGTAGTSASELAGALDVLGAPCTLYAGFADIPAFEATDILVLFDDREAEIATELAAEENAWRLIEAAQALAAGAVAGARLWALTAGVRAMSGPRALGQSPVWGIGRIVAGERPDLWGGIVDAAEGVSPSALAGGILAILSAREAEDVYCVSDESMEVLRLAPISAAGGETSHCGTATCLPDAAYLVTGGLGALGLEAAAHLVAGGARHVLLAGRRGLPPREEWTSVTDPAIRRAIARIAALEAAGATIIPLALEIGDEVAVREALDISRIGRPIRGIVHAAGVFEGGMIGQIGRDALRRVLAPKIGGALALHRTFAPKSLDFFVCFSSSGQLARLSGQSAYAAANSFLDGLCALRAATGESGALSLGWMAWHGLGMSESIDATMIEARARGLDAISVAQALQAWKESERSSRSYAAVFAISRDYDRKAILPLLSEVLNDVSTSADQGGETGVEVPEEGRLDWLGGDIRSIVARELGTASEDVDLRRSLIDMGVDSLMTVALRIRLKARYGIEFPPTLLWSNPSVSAIAQFTDTQLALSPASAETAPAPALA